MSSVRLRVYVDTSVFSARLDDRAPDRRRESEAFWVKAEGFDVSTSELTRDELAATDDDARRADLLRLLEGVSVFPVTVEMDNLASAYVALGAFADTDIADATHVAAAVLTRQDILVSWNFRHLVNRQRRARIGEVNVSFDLPHLDILAPPEL